MKRRSICYKIFFVFLAGILFNTLFLILFTGISGSKFLYALGDENIRNISFILGKYIGEDLYNEDYSQVQIKLNEVVLSNPAIDTCRIYDRSGDLRAISINGSREDYPPLPETVDLDGLEEYKGEISGSRSSLILSGTLSREQEVTGGIIIQYNRIPLRNQVRRVRYLLVVHALAALIVGGIIFFFIIRRISLPLSELSRIMRHYGEEDFSFDYNYDGNDEIGDLAQSLNRMSDQIRENFALLKNSEERFELAVQGSHDGIWDYDTSRDTVYTSPRCREILNAEDSRLRCLKDWISCIAEEDKDSFLKAIHMLLQNREDILDLECRVRGQGTKVKWVHLKGKGIFAPSGKCTRIAGSLSDISEQKKTEDKLIKAAMYDSLTGLPNRVYLLDRLQLILNRKKRHPDKNFAVLFLDYDGFKKINDTYGHSMGDRILHLIARRLKRCVRPEDLISRIGGDEFVILLEDCGEKEDIARISQRILDASSREFKEDSSSIFLSVSIGIVTDETPFHTHDELLQFSDIAMYHAKNKGKGTYSFYREEMYSRISYQWKIQNDLHKAVSNEELYLVYHPIIALEDFRVMGAEALLRWEHPERGMISPVDFIPSAEESHYIVQLTDWLLQELIKIDPHKLTNSNGESIRISFNLSSRDFISHPSILSRIQNGFPYGSPLLNFLDAEITETTLIESFELVSHQLSQLRNMGLKIKLDDFGTGFSSLSYLHNFPLDELKIDRSFVHSIPENPVKVNIVRHIINLAHDLGIKVIAEGIERIEQHQILRELGCDMGQGYLYAKPMKCQDFRSFLSKKAVDRVSEWDGGILFL